MAEPFTSAEQIATGQLSSLNALLRGLIPANLFYNRKASQAKVAANYNSLAEYRSAFPFTTKEELVADQEQNPIYGTNLTYPLEAYSRLHATSGTTGKPLRWLDTPGSWEMLVDCWTRVYKAAGVTHHDIGFFAFSFGPFLGFWVAFEAANRMGMLSLPGGGLSSLARLQILLQNKVTVLCCTPSYAIHLADAAAENRISLAEGSVRKIIVAGEAGGSLPATRAHIEKLWPGAVVYDHHGMTETGPVSYQCPLHPGRLHIIDECYLAEVINPATLAPVEDGETGELILTTLKRTGSPLLRYRTRDLVRKPNTEIPGAPCDCGSFETALEGGIIGRTDDMIVVRGVNIYPTAIEQIVREFPEIAEYQAHVSKKGSMTQLHLVIEPSRETRNVTGLVVELEKALQTAFNLRIPVTAAPEKSLPRAELKSRRWLVS